MLYLYWIKNLIWKGNDQIEIDREKAAFPATEEEANKLWEERVKNDVISLKLKR